MEHEDAEIAEELVLRLFLMRRSKKKTRKVTRLGASQTMKKRRKATKRQRKDPREKKTPVLTSLLSVLFRCLSSRESQSRQGHRSFTQH